MRLCIRPCSITWIFRFWVHFASYSPAKELPNQASTYTQYKIINIFKRAEPDRHVRCSLSPINIRWPPLNKEMPSMSYWPLSYSPSTSTRTYIPSAPWTFHLLQSRRYCPKSPWGLQRDHSDPAKQSHHLYRRPARRTKAAQHSRPALLKVHR